MNKTLKPLFACLFSGLICTGAAAAEPQVINIKTDGSSMVMSVTSDGEVLFHHFGGRIDDATPVTGIKSYRRTDHGTDNLAYSTMGGRNFREPALRVTHADGDMNTELRYVSHTTRTLADTNVTRTVIKLTDTNQALDVELFYTAYAEENVITTHAVIRNREKGSIVLHSFYSSFEEHRVTQAGTHDAYRESGLHDYARQRVVRRELRRGDRRSTGMER